MKTCYYCVFSLWIRLIFDKKTVTGIKMNPTNRITNTIVQLSPINAPFNDGIIMNVSIDFILKTRKSQTYICENNKKYFKIPRQKNSSCFPAKNSFKFYLSFYNCFNKCALKIRVVLPQFITQFFSVFS